MRADDPQNTIVTFDDGINGARAQIEVDNRFDADVVTQNVIKALPRLKICVGLLAWRKLP